jgi:lipopolysaccharide transport system ATP-binding protein
MYLRLAFAVAAHLDPEILLVDEVLAVGDVGFQNKCLGKMGDVAKQGRTILFVSHNMGAVRSLCDKGIVLHGGRLAYAGEIGRSIEQYHRLADAGSRDNSAGRSRRGSGFSGISLESREGSTIQQSDPVEVITTLHIANEVAGFALVCTLEDMRQRPVFHLRRDSSELPTRGPWKGAYRISLKLPPLWLEPGLYTLYFKAIFQGEAASSKHLSDAFHLDVGGRSCGFGSILSPDMHWTIEQAADPSAVANA